MSELWLDGPAQIRAIVARIVCGVDGSSEGLEAVRQASRLAAPESTITLVSVSETHLAVHTGMMAAKWAEQLNEEAKAALDEALAVADGAETRLLHGRAADALLRTLAEQRATLAAVGSHEISRGVGILIGTVGTRLIHEAPCSVLVARAPSGSDPWPRSIIVGLDGSGPSLAAAELGRELAERTAASIQFVIGRGAHPADIAPDELAGCGFDLTFSEAKPVPALLEAAREADLLIVGSRGLTGLRALGSVSERVAHQADCSLLIVRPPSA